MLNMNGGFVLAGSSTSSDGDLTENKGQKDAWIAELDANGDLVWQESFGGSFDDGASSIQQTSDLGYIVVGQTSSNDGDVSQSKGNSDAWIIKLSNTGDLEWEQTFGGSYSDRAAAVIETSANHYILLGESFSVDGDVN